MKALRNLHLPLALSLALSISGSGTLVGIHGQNVPVVLQGGRVLTVTEGIIENGTVVMQNGRITAVGTSVTIPAGARVIDVAGKSVMPGLIDGYTNLGTADYPSFGEDDDEATHPVTPHMRVIDGLNPANRFFPWAINSGVTAALSAPAEGNLLPGQSALIRLNGATVEEMVLDFPAGVHVTLGEAPKARYGAKSRAPMTRMGSAALLRQTLIDATEYAEKLAAFQRKQEAHEADPETEKPTPVPRDLKLEALLPVLRGDTPLIVGADRFDDILTAMRITAEFELRMILRGGAEAHRLAEELKEREISVLWGPGDARFGELEAKDGSPRTPALLAAMGIPFAFQTGSIENVTGLLAEARTAFAQGLSYEETLRGLTLYPARILGVEDDLGSLEVGKSADLIVFDGDPVEDAATVERVFIGGIEVAGPG